MSKIVEVQRLTRAYGGTKAVDEISFSLEEGKIYGLLGRNGAGKTTLMHMLTAQQLPTSGTVKVFGENPYENNRVLKQICFIKESQRYPDNYHVKDVLELAPALFKHWDEEFAYSLAEQFRLPLKKRVKQLSRGLLSSVGIVVGLASRAPLTIFDEPYLGLDAVARSLFYDRLMEDYTEHPRTVILSTHLIDEVSKLLEHVLVIDGGKLLIDEDTESLRGRAFTVAGPAQKVDAFAQGKEVLERQPLGGFVACTMMGGMDAAERKEAEELGLGIEPVSLQQLMVRLTGQNAPGKVGGKL